jgi:hypothetical protein
MAVLLTPRTPPSVTSGSDALMRAELIRGIIDGSVGICPDVRGQQEDGVERLIIEMADVDHRYEVEVESVHMGVGCFQFNRLYMDGFRLGGDVFGQPVVQAIQENTNLFGGM